MTPEDSPTPEDFLLQLLGTGALPGLPEPVDRVPELVELHGLEGLAVARGREEGSASLPGELRTRWEPAYRARGLESVVVLEAAARAREALAGRGMASLLFKGAALVADGTYPDPGARRMDDADLLVRPEDAPAAVEALMESGFEPVGDWGGERVRWADALTLRDREAPAGTLPVLDLHWRTGYDRLRFGEDGAASVLWNDVDPAAGIPAPGPHLVVVAEHLLKHLRFRVHLAAYGDLARMATSVGDWEGVEAMVEASRLERGLRSLLLVLAREMGAPVPETLLRDASGRLGTDLSPRTLAGTRRVAGHRLSGLLLRGRLVGSPRAVLADLREAVLPSGSWLRARYGTGVLRGWIRYLVDLVRWATYRGRSPASPNQELFHPTARE